MYPASRNRGLGKLEEKPAIDQNFGREWLHNLECVDGSDLGKHICGKCSTASGMWLGHWGAVALSAA
ncbi:hypothetical protein IFM47457_08735 [Aspergillus lentulus]|nr:hypothetical protein IFM47457_08735 [Aspergillus lentulus]